MQSTANVLSATQRRWFTALAALMVAAGASHTTRAAEPSVQRVAMACTGSDCAANSRAHAGVVRHAVAAEAALARSTPSEALSRRAANARQDNDGDRFRYDSCGCSGS